MKQALTTTVHLLNILIMLFILKVVMGFGLFLLTLYHQMSKVFPASGLI
jgi:hypothetical protein